MHDTPAPLAPTTEAEERHEATEGATCADAREAPLVSPHAAMARPVIDDDDRINVPRTWKSRITEALDILSRDGTVMVPRSMYEWVVTFCTLPPMRVGPHQLVTNRRELL